MKWTKRGQIFAPNDTFDWMVSHASIPVVDQLSDEAVRIYFGARDAKGRSLPSYIEVDGDDLQKIRYVHDRPILSLGRPGTFDDSGIMPSWIVNRADRKYLYYIGWNREVTVPYRLSIGLAISDDGGRRYHKYSEGPLCDRSVTEPYFNTAPCVLVDNRGWRMWYVSCTKWEIIHDRPEPFYNIRCAESPDGIHWARPGHLCLDYDDFTNALARPCVYIEGGTYKMIYSYRSVYEYRTDPRQSYRLGYAESVDGWNWVRKDSEVGIDRSDSGWDSQMMEYCYILERNGRKNLLYNGDGFGKTGFGYAVLEEG
jgi:hypothetical protein